MARDSGVGLFQGPTKSQPLAIWNQVARRQYMSVCLCFPTDEGADESGIFATVRAALDRLAAKRPDFAGSLQVETRSGSIHLQTGEDDIIPLEQVDASVTINIPFSRLQEQGFPADAFLDHSFKESFVTQDGLVSHGRASCVKLSFIEGGMLLWIHLNHAFADGICLRWFIECLAAETRGEDISRPSSQVLDKAVLSKGAAGKVIMLDDLLKPCPELAVLENCRGPGTTISAERALNMDNGKKSEKIFVFQRQKVEELRNLIKETSACPQTPSIYQCLGALTWASVTKARLIKFAGKSKIRPETESKLMNSVNWREKVFQNETKEYFGNTTTYPIAKTQVQQVVRAANDIKSLAAIIEVIDKSIKSVDEDFVAAQTAVMAACPDIRLLRSNIDLMNPLCMGFNTWRHFGADVEWEIPGVASRKPEAVRRASAGIAVGTALILPGKKDSEEYEITISLMAEDMETLCQSQDWMRWVGRIIG